MNEAYTSKCLNAINLESFTVTDSVSEYHYTLYYYDQAGNLIKTVPPEGVHPDWDIAWLSSVEAAKASGTIVVPAHTLATVYRYNSLNQVVSQNTPDAGISSFWYDKLGRLAISQNAKQHPLNNYSYTLYDYIGRIREVGQKLQPTAMTNTISRDTSALAAWLNFNNSTFDYNAVQVTSTVYDVVSGVTQLTAPVVTANPVTFTQQPYTLRNRVSYTQYYDVLQNNAPGGGVSTYTPIYGNYTTGTYYAYDIHGNVDTLLQDYRLGTMASHGYNRFKEIAYNYDLISGKVNEVDYQPGAIDQFYHRYEYDAENRITDVYTSDNKAYVGNKSLEEHEAFYQYYKHGPLARAVIGQQQVQGPDYAYTLEGWLKGVNSTSLQPANDIGNDGLAGSANQNVARDAYGFNLNYFTGEYSAINSGVLPFPGHTGYMSSTDYKPLYNGNISSMAVNIGKLNQPLLYNYQYDQLNRIVSMDAFNGLNQTGNDWTGLTKINDYQERISYDANGNIQTYLRNGTTTGGTPLAMDNLTYNYNLDANGHLQNNKLTSVNDAVAASNYPNDIDDQSANNYSYDAIGNLVQDNAGGINTITWTVYGKISSIAKADGSTIAYTYDAAGNRISKTVTPASGPAIITWYVRDASGNVMALYTATGSDSLHQSEQHLYGSSRLGIYNRNINADAALPTGTSASLIGSYFTSNFTRGNKVFELSNHLGNVLETVSDKKIGHNSGSGTIDYYTPDVVTANDYYPFGSLMPGRTYSVANTNYRYGFNGKENDNDIETGMQDYGMRIYDTRLGRFLSVDLYSNKFPWYSPYQFSGNTPMQAIDLDGLETVNVQTGKIDNSLNPSSINFYQHSSDFKPWMDLGNFKPAQTIVNAMDKRFFINPIIQNVESAVGTELNLDYYSVTISKLPIGWENPNDLVDHIRQDFGSFVNSKDMIFSAKDADELKIWYSKNPESAVMTFSQDLLYGLYTENADVMTSRVTPSYWTFTTVTTLLGHGGHPVSGTRQFGIVENVNNGSKTYTFFVRGFDRIHSYADVAGDAAGGNMWSGAGKVWNRLIQNVTNFVNKYGGKATANTPISRRVSWKNDYMKFVESQRKKTN
jgi:RHS repeat-associated protein